uniref:Muskelin-like n=1 Tax=Hirondellea gigas TaxID=1518452 RepID=A0A2P2I5A8_9CRUS
MNTMEDLKASPTIVLKFRIHKCSSYSSKFGPENIIEDKPEDQTSRWSTDSHIPPQFVMMKLEAPAIVTSITFGKYEKTHVCNVRKLQVWGGLTEEQLLLLLDGGLKNDSHAETFTLKHIVDNNPFPVRFIRLVPLQAWGSTFNISVWHVSLSGVNDPALVRRCQHTYTLYSEREALRVCLKHLRHKRYTNAYAALTRETNTRLEHPVLTQLYRACTEFEHMHNAEEILAKAAHSGLLTEYLQGQPLVPMWRQLRPPPGALPNSTPGMRGGHQLCFDSATQTIYLFGGWDGQQDLNDLWCYNISKNTWTCISPDTTLQGGPSPRSCHKVCIDPDRRQLFTLGRYVDSRMRSPDNLKSDFFLYELETGRWTQITEDTGEEGGPKIIFDHQMVMDVKNRVIFVFGGRVLTQSRWEGVSLDSASAAGLAPSDPQFSGMYRYHVATNTWTCLRPDDTHLGTAALTHGSNTSTNATATTTTTTTTTTSSRSNAIRTSRVDNIASPRQRPSSVGDTSSSSSSGPTSSGSSSSSATSAAHVLKSRVGHSMLFHPISRQLFILAGQRHKEYLTDFFTYQVDTDVVGFIGESSQSLASNGRSMTTMAGSVTTMGGMSTTQADGAALLGAGFPNKPLDVPTAGFTQKATIDPILQEIHVLSGLSKEKDKRDLVCNSFWVYSIPLNKWSCIYHNEVSGDGPDDGAEPCPRYAHQLVYDHHNKVHYMFGGNPGRHQQPKMRLDDFWALQLCRPTPQKLIKEAVFAIRKNRYEELAVQDSALALQYLQTELHQAIDHTNQEQVKEFQRLACTLFQPSQPDLCHPPPLTSQQQPPPLHIPQFDDILYSDAPPPAMDGCPPPPLIHQDQVTISHQEALMAASSSSTIACSSSNVSSMKLNCVSDSFNLLNYDGDSSSSTSGGGGSSSSMAYKDPAKEQFFAWRHHRRSELFNYLAKFFPEDMTQPKTNLEDLVPL